MKPFLPRPAVFLALLLTGLGGAAASARADASPGTLDASFDPGAGVDSQVESIAIQPDGKIILTGGFTGVNGVQRRAVARLNADGSVDAGFDTSGLALSGASSCALQTDGKLVIGGNFTTVGGVTHANIARLNADGSVDNNFNPIAGGEVNHVALQPDGKILLCGEFGAVNNSPHKYIGRINADGTLDGTFHQGAGSGADSVVNGVAVQADGKILICGSFVTYDDMPRRAVARLNANGTLDTSFDPGAGPGGSVYSVGLQPDGKILLWGDFIGFAGTARATIVRLNADGTVDSTFDAGAGATGIPRPNVSSIRAVQVQANGKIVVGGFFTMLGTTTRNYLGRLNADGSVDTGFDPGSGADGGLFAVAIAPDGQIVIGGDFQKYDGALRGSVARVNGDVVLLAPVISSALTASAQVGTFFTYQTTASNSPTSYGADKLPAGLSIDPASGLISGTPTESGDFAVTLTATNGAGSGTSALALTVAPSPVSVVALTVKTANARSGGAPAVLILTRTGGDQAQPLTVHYKVRGDARPLVDYKKLTGKKNIPADKDSAKLKIVAKGDLGGAARKTLKISLLPGDGYTIDPSAAPVKVKLIAP